MNIRGLFCSILLILLNAVCAQNAKNKDLIDYSNAHKFIGNKETIIKKQKLTYVKDKGFKILTGFKNNPYNLDNSYKVLLIINKTIIFDGDFTNHGFETIVPLKLLNVQVSPRLIIYKKNKYYTFGCDQAQKTITNKDNMIHIVFMPTNEYESIYFISTNGNLNQN